MLTAVVLAVLVGAGSARAGTETKRDGNDVAGRLDIRSISQGHDAGPGHRFTFTVKTFARWPTALLGPSTPNYLLLRISKDADPAPEILVLVVSTPRRLVAGWFSGRGKFIERVRVSRPDRRSVRVNFSRVELDRHGAYRWQALAYFRGASCPRGCLDRAPNGSRQMLHDLIAPKVSFPQPPPPEGVTYNLDFSVSDRGGSQLDFWRLEQRDPGTLGWNVVDQQATTGAQSVEFTAGLPGDTDEFRVVARDRHGNSRVTPVLEVTAPP